MCNMLATVFLPQESAVFYLMEIPQGTTWKMAENRTLKAGSSPPRAEEKIRPATKDHTFDRFLRDFDIDYGREIWHSS